jgi:hypothetical protein
MFLTGALLAVQERVFKLSNGSGGLGLGFENERFTLAGVPLLREGSDGLEVRPLEQIEMLIGRAYDDDFDAIKLTAGLDVVARALNAGDQALANTAAVLLKLPELDWAGAVRIAQAEDALQKYSEDEPRDWHGRWTDEDGAGEAESASDPTDIFKLPEDWIHLPPGERIDELGDLAEWIANAKPEDEAGIRADIKRFFYDVGDGQGGDGISRLLDDALRPGVSLEDRQTILDQLDHFTHTDPAEAAGFTNLVLTSIMTAPAFVEMRGTTAFLGIGREAEVASDVWKLGWGLRGATISKALGENLLSNFPVIDRFSEGVATSIKSIDLNANTYQDAARLTSLLNGYVNKVAAFNGIEWGTVNILPEEITGRTLNLAIPKGIRTVAQRAALQAVQARAKSLGVNFIVTPF